MHVTAKADYAVGPSSSWPSSSQGSPRKVDDVAQAQGIPVSFLENILTQLRSTGIVRSQRGPEGGYWLAQPAAEVSLARHHPRCRGARSSACADSAPRRSSTSARPRRCRDVWIALRANLRKVLEQVTVADVAAGQAAEGRDRADSRRGGLANPLGLAGRREAASSVARGRSPPRSLRPCLACPARPRRSVNGYAPIARVCEARHAPCVLASLAQRGLEGL